MLNTYVVEGGVGKCTAFTALLPKLKKKSEVQIYTPYIDCFAGNPDVKLALEQTIPLQDPRIMSSDNIYYCEPYKSNFQFGKQHLIESYCEHHGVKYDKSITNCPSHKKLIFHGMVSQEIFFAQLASIGTYFGNVV